MCLFFFFALAAPLAHDDLADIDVASFGRDDLNEMLEHFANGDKARWGRISRLLREIDEAKAGRGARIRRQQAARRDREAIEARHRAIEDVKRLSKAAHDLRVTLEMLTSKAIGEENFEAALRERLVSRVENSPEFREFANSAKQKDGNVTDATIRAVYFAKVAVDAVDAGRLRRARLSSGVASEAVADKTKVSLAAASAAQSAKVAVDSAVAGKDPAPAIGENVRKLWRSLIE